MNNEYLLGAGYYPAKLTKLLMVNWSSSLLDKSSKPITSLRVKNCTYEVSLLNLKLSATISVIWYRRASSSV